MDKIEMLGIFDREQRQGEEFPGAYREVGERVTRTVIRDEHFGFIPYFTLDETNADAEIEAQLAYFRSQGIGFEWKVYDHDRPVDLRDRLSAHGFEIEPPEALVVLDMQNAPDFYWTRDVSCVEKITKPEELKGIIQMEEEIWGGDHSWMQVRLGHDLVETPDRLSVFTVPMDGRVVSAAWVYYHPGTQFASLWGGSTLAAYRGRGYYTALLAVRAREARERGYRFLTVDASPMSRPILEKHGFQFLGFSTPCKWTPESEEGSHG
jgi:GNAT superfamily N-acetyltransferase